MIRDDYFFGPIQEERSDKIYALVIYDIKNNKKRIRFAKFLQGFGIRIQKSGFEINVDKTKFDKLVKEIPEYCTDQDSIRIYRISSRSEVMKWGIGLSKKQDSIILL